RRGSPNARSARRPLLVWRPAPPAARLSRGFGRKMLGTVWSTRGRQRTRAVFGIHLPLPVMWQPDLLTTQRRRRMTVSVGRLVAASLVIALGTLEPVWAQTPSPPAPDAPKEEKLTEQKEGD